MCLEAAQAPSPNILHRLMFPNFKKIGGFFGFVFFSLPHTFTGELVLAIFKSSCCS